MEYVKARAEGFRHVADAHRHLVEAVYARTEASLPHDGVSDASHEAAGMVYARALLEFYLGRSRRPGDITKADLGITYSPTPNDERVLAATKGLIDKHLAHLTWVRDPNHPDRSSYPHPNDPPNACGWTHELIITIETVIDIARRIGRDGHPEFVALADATESRFAEAEVGWPTTWPERDVAEST